MNGNEKSFVCVCVRERERERERENLETLTKLKARKCVKNTRAV